MLIYGIIGRVIERESDEFNDFVAVHSVKTIPATRSIIVVDVHQVGSSCGYSVPFYDFKEYRSTLNEVFEKKTKAFETGKSQESMPRYWAYKNAWSIGEFLSLLISRDDHVGVLSLTVCSALDGLPGMAKAIETGARERVEPITKMIGPWAPAAPFGPQSYKLSNQLRYQLTKLDTTKVQLKSVLLMVMLSFLVGIVVAMYGPLLVESQRGRMGRLLM